MLGFLVSDDDSTTVGAAITFLLLTHSVLKSLDPVTVSMFIRETHVAEKRVKLPTITGA